MYRAITGQIPPDALDRKEEDTLEPPSRLGVAIPPAAEQALKKALAVNAQSRFQNMGEFQAALRSEATMPSSPAAQVSGGFTQPHPAPPRGFPVASAAQIPPQPGPVRRKKGSTATSAILISVSAVVLVGSGVLWFASKSSYKAEAPQRQAGLMKNLVATKTTGAKPAPTSAPPAAPQPAIRAPEPTLSVPATPSQYVVDLAGVIDANTKVRLNAMLRDLEANTTAQMVVLTIKSLDGEPIENFSHQTAVKWGIGQKGKNNGVLLTVAVKDRKYRIEVGYGLESTLPDNLIILSIVTFA